MSATIPYGKQQISQADIDAVTDVLTSDFLTQGPMVPRFEQAVAHYTGSRYGIACNSATSALHIACLALGVQQQDYVWTSPNSFVASSNCALYCGAKVDFVDIDLNTGNMCIQSLTAKLAQAKQQQSLPKALIVVHFAGQSCDMASIAKLATEYGFKVIEDASHAIGGSFQQAKVGACQYSDITVFSFHPVKIITTAEGGMALTNNATLARTMERLRSHGITRQASEMNAVSHGRWYYQQLELGFNYRMSDLHAALGLRQLDDLDKWIEQRHHLATRYDHIFSTPKWQERLIPLQRNQRHQSALHLYVVRLIGLSAAQKAQLFDLLANDGFGVNVHYIPIHLQPYYYELGFRQGDFPTAETYYQQALTLPLFPALSEQQQEHIVACLDARLREILQ